MKFLARKAFSTCPPNGQFYKSLEVEYSRSEVEMLLTPSLLWHNYKEGTSHAITTHRKAKNAPQRWHFACLDVCCYGLKPGRQHCKNSNWMIWSNESAPLCLVIN